MGNQTPPTDALSPAPSPTSLASNSKSEAAVLPCGVQRALSPPPSPLRPPSQLATPSWESGLLAGCYAQLPLAPGLFVRTSWGRG